MSDKPRSGSGEGSVSSESAAAIYRDGMRAGMRQVLSYLVLVAQNTQGAEVWRALFAEQYLKIDSLDVGTQPEWSKFFRELKEGAPALALDFTDCTDLRQPLPGARPEKTLQGGTTEVYPEEHTDGE